MVHNAEKEIHMSIYTYTTNINFINMNNRLKPKTIIFISGLVQLNRFLPHSHTGDTLGNSHHKIHCVTPTDSP